MAYNQQAYQEKVGNGPYPIAQIGCLLTSFCNLAASFSITVDPPTLNTFFIDHNDYLADPGDGAGVKDDLAWTSITAYNSNIVVTGTGSGWPTTNNAIVKFYYKSSRTGAMETHFCKMSDYTKKLILDSWDGVVKESGEYGTPIGYATYGDAKVQPVVTAANPSPVVVSHPTTPPPSGPTSLFLPAAAGRWRVYNPGGPYTVGHEIHFLYPGAFPPGLTYPIIKTLDPHIYLIPTEDYGQVAIYAGPDTIAQFPAGGHGDGESDSAATYTAFDKAMDLVTNKEATVYDYNTGEASSTVPAGTRIIAGGKAVNGDNVYFVDINSVHEGQTLGVKTIDLSPYEPTVADEDPGEKIPVKVTNWKDSYTAFMNPQRYVANTVSDIKDIDDDENPLPDQTLAKGQTIQIAGQFTRDGVPFYRSANSVTAETWYGVPITSVTKVGSDDELHQILEDMSKEETTAVKAVTSSGGLLSRLFNKKKGS